MAFFRFTRVRLPLFCPFLSNALTRRHLDTKTETTAHTSSSPSQTHERKGFSCASFPFGGAARSHARAERKKKRSLTSRFVHGELDIEFRGVLIIGARRGGGGGLYLGGTYNRMYFSR